MALQSMTGFARAEGVSGRYRWVWELRSVNGKGLDVRLRLPPGLDHLDTPLKALAGEVLTRGNIQAGLTLAVSENRLEAVLNREALAAVMALREELRDIIDPAPLSMEQLFAIRGLVDFREVEEDSAAREERDRALVAGFLEARDALVAMRHSEGLALEAVLSGHIAQIEALAAIIEDDPQRRPDDIARKLAGQVAALIGASSALDRDRLHQEAALLATKFDTREELDRLKAHVQASRELLKKGGPVGRKLDFMAQEFNRESNTICSKSNSAAVTAAGIELKVVIDQFREQVQNLE
nr:YicC/YloC family endoribonuclease [uncultured Gellertiella sp.]